MHLCLKFSIKRTEMASLETSELTQYFHGVGDSDRLAFSYFHLADVLAAVVRLYDGDLPRF